MSVLRRIENQADWIKMTLEDIDPDLSRDQKEVLEEAAGHLIQALVLVNRVAYGDLPTPTITMEEDE